VKDIPEQISLSKFLKNLRSKGGRSPITRKVISKMVTTSPTFIPDSMKNMERNISVKLTVRKYMLTATARFLYELACT
jgi:hypothetical protein